MHLTPREQKQPVEPFKCIDISQWHNRDVPARRWLVPGVLLKGTVALVSGDGGVGKSLLMQQLLTACACGKSWLGMDVAHVRGFGFFAEDDEDELWRRQANINLHYGVDMLEVHENILMSSRVGKDNILMTFEKYSDVGKPTVLFDQILYQLRDFGAQLTVIDTAADTFGGIENIRTHVRQFINSLRRYALEVDGGVILTAHPSVQGMSTGTGISGSTAWNNSVRGRAYLTRPKDEDDGIKRELKIMKANYAGLDKFSLEWRNGVFQRIMPPRHWTEEVEDI